MRKKKFFYTPTEVKYCVGMECVYEFYGNNSYWKYIGIIEPTAYEDVFLVVNNSRQQQKVHLVRIEEILSIPLYDACKGSSMLRLILGDIDG